VQSEANPNVHLVYVF